MSFGRDRFTFADSSRRRSRRRNTRLVVEALEPRVLLHGTEIHGPWVGPSHSDEKEPSWLNDVNSTSRTTSSSVGPIQTLAAPYPLSDTFRLHSNPTANHTIYLDFDGHTTSGTSWGGGATFTVQPFDPSADGAAFNNTELERIQRVWQRVAEDFSMFNVNVTTQEPPVSDLMKSGTGDTRWGVRAVTTPTDWSGCGCGGHAYIGSFNDATDEPVFVYNTSEIGVAAALSHELGHAVYLAHDGVIDPATGALDEYYDGHGTGEEGWGPIMGSGYYKNVTTWDNGTYYQANNTGASANYNRGADDFTVITNNNGFGLLADEASNTAAAATNLSVNGTVAGQFAVITTDADVDYFKFTTGGGSVSLTVDSYYSRAYVPNGSGGYNVSYLASPTGTTSQGTNLDVLARLHDSTGAVIATANPTGLTTTSNLSASFNVSLAAGTYYISVDGTGSGNWAASPPTGYGSHVSRGQYYIRGTIPSAVNTPPVANNDTATTNEDTSASINVLANDTDADGHTLSITAVSAPANGTATQSGSSIVFAPAANFFGNTSFTYTISDGNGGSATATVNVTVNSVNDAPVAAADSATTNEDTSVVVTVLANDSDIDGGTLSVTARTNGAKGSVTINANGTLTYAPNANANGADSFTYTISDGQGGSATGTVNVSITAVNDAPTAGNDSVVTDLNTAVTISVLANDADVDGNTLSVTSASTPASGTAVVNANNTITYTPNTGFLGSDSFTYSISDGNGGTANATVSVTVQHVNVPPTAGNDSATTNEDTAVVVAVLANDSDSDGGTLSVTAVTQGTKGVASINAGGTVTYTPNANANGADSFTYTVSDGQGGTAVGTVAVAITAVNDAPVAANDSASTSGSTAVTINVLANDSDIDSGTLSVSIVASPANGTATVGAGGTVTYTANAGFVGTDTFSYTANDGALDSNVATVTVSVLGGTKFFVVDNGRDDTFRYRADGSYVSWSDLGTGNTNPQGVAANADGSRLWVIDRGRKIYVYDGGTNALIGSWTPNGLNTPVGVTVWGNDLWIVDSNSDRVFYYAGGATRTTGSANATSSFALNGSNRNPLDLVTDGTNIWVTQSGGTDRVFVYQASNGAMLGNWTIDVGNSAPVGITLDPTNSSNDLWIVDNGTDRVYRYDNGRARTTGSQAAASWFALNSLNGSAQGIADPLTAALPAPTASSSDGAIERAIVLPNVDQDSAFGTAVPTSSTAATAEPIRQPAIVREFRAAAADLDRAWSIRRDSTRESWQAALDVLLADDADWWRLG